MLGSTIGRTHPAQESDEEGRSGGIVRTEPRDVAPVIPLPVRMHGNRIIEPLDVPPGTLLGNDVAGRLARALMALHTTGTR